MDHKLMQEVNSRLREMLDESDEEDDISPLPPRYTPPKIESGILARIHGLKSAAGSKLNGCRCIVIHFVHTEQRWKVRIENASDGATLGIKEMNLEVIPCLTLPSGHDRGNVTSMGLGVVPKSCELLVYYKGASMANPRGEYQPSQIVFSGFPSRMLGRMGMNNFMYFVTIQMEQLGGVLALANICSEDEAGTAAVLFGLLEGDPMYIDVLIQTMHWTGLIKVESDEASEEFEEGFSNVPPTELTGDQDSKAYIRSMMNGPLRILNEVMKYNFQDALWGRMKKSEYYHLFVQRLLRWIGRESCSHPTQDGKELGPLARKIICKICPTVRFDEDSPVSQEVADALLDKEGVGLLIDSPNMVDGYYINEAAGIGNDDSSDDDDDDDDDSQE